MIIRIVVVLPAPFGPMKPYSAPVGMARSRSMTALVAPKALHTFSSRMASGIAVESIPYVQLRHSCFRDRCGRGRRMPRRGARADESERRLVAAQIHLR